MATKLVKLFKTAISMRSRKCIPHSVKRTCFMDYGEDVVFFSKLTQQCRLSKTECGIRQCKCMKMLKFVLGQELLHIPNQNIICGRITGFDVPRNFKNGSYYPISLIKRITLTFSWSAPGECLTGQPIETCWRIMSTVLSNSLQLVVKCFLH